MADLTSLPFARFIATGDSYSQTNIESTTEITFNNISEQLGDFFTFTLDTGQITLDGGTYLIMYESQLCVYRLSVCTTVNELSLQLYLDDTCIPSTASLSTSYGYGKTTLSSHAIVVIGESEKKILSLKNISPVSINSYGSNLLIVKIGVYVDTLN